MKTERDIKEHKADDLKECSVEKERLEGVTKRLVESKITLPTLDEVKDFLEKIRLTRYNGLLTLTALNSAIYG